MFIFESFHPIYKGKPNFDILVCFMIHSISPQFENNKFTGTLLWEREKNKFKEYYVIINHGTSTSDKCDNFFFIISWVTNYNSWKYLICMFTVSI